VGRAAVAPSIDSSDAAICAALQMQSVIDDSRIGTEKASFLLGRDPVLAAIKDELNSTIDTHGVYKWVNPNTAVPRDAYTITSSAFLKAQYTNRKFTKWKFRTVAGGHRQKSSYLTKSLAAEPLFHLLVKTFGIDHQRNV
jgi:hypothetical protein